MRIKIATWVSAAAFAVVLFIFMGCTSTTPIKTLLDDPGRYNGKTVSIAGDVSSAVGVLNYGAFKVNDGTGSILVVTKASGAPRDGAKVGVQGKFTAGFTFGTETVAAIEEEKRFTP